MSLCEISPLILPVSVCFALHEKKSLDVVIYLFRVILSGFTERVLGLQWDSSLPLLVWMVMAKTHYLTTLGVSVSSSVKAILRCTPEFPFLML